MEQFFQSLGHKVQFCHKWLLHMHAWMWHGELQPWKATTLSPWPLPSVTACACLPKCSSSLLLLEPQIDCDKLRQFLRPTDVINIWEMHPSVFQWHDRGAASFSAPSSPSLPAPSCGLPAIHPRDSSSSRKDCVGDFRLTWFYQAEINWAEYLWACLLGRAVSGCAKFRKLKKRREKSRNRCFWESMCAHAC